MRIKNVKLYGIYEPDDKDNLCVFVGTKKEICKFLDKPIDLVNGMINCTSRFKTHRSRHIVKCGTEQVTVEKCKICKKMKPIDYFTKSNQKICNECYEERLKKGLDKDENSKM